MSNRRYFRVLARLSLAGNESTSPGTVSVLGIFVFHAACRRRICRCFRAFSNFRSRSAWISR
jgi:hypothetical protein